MSNPIAFSQNQGVSHHGELTMSEYAGNAGQTWGTQTSTPDLADECYKETLHNPDPNAFHRCLTAKVDNNPFAGTTRAPQTVVKGQTTSFGSAGILFLGLALVVIGIAYLGPLRPSIVVNI